jgi:cation diffusion facilitator family transporter
MDRGEKVAVISIGTNIALLGIKYLFARLSGSMALMADVIHSSSDVVAALTVFAGLKISKRKSKGFPYGLYKVENLVSLLISVVILFAGYEIVKEAILGGGDRQIQNIPATIAGVLAVIGITFGLGWYEIRVGRQINSPSIEADGHHVQTDMLSSVVVLISLVGGLFGFQMDRFAAGIMAIFIAHAGIKIFVDAIRVLLDASVDFETLDKAKGIILSEPAVREIKSLTGRNSGSYKFIEAEIVLNVRDLEKAHFISQRIEQKLKEEISHIDHVLIHYEPIRKESITCAVPLESLGGKVSPHFGEAPFFGIYTISSKTGELLRREIVGNPFLSEERGKGIMVAEMLIRRGVDVVVIGEPFHGKGPEYAFSDAGVEIQQVDAETAEEALRSLGYIGGKDEDIGGQR